MIPSWITDLFNEVASTSAGVATEAVSTFLPIILGIMVVGGIIGMVFALVRRIGGAR